MKAKGLFVTFEGTEGAGKSTLIRAVAARLKREQPRRRVVVTREPGGSPVAEKIRELILAQKMDPRAELFLYEAARADHLARVIRPALAAGAIVLCDRYADSSLAYQAHARGLPWKYVHEANRLATGGLTPRLTVLLDIDPATGVRRARDKNRFEAEGIAFHRKVRRGFLKARAEDPGRWLKLQADEAPPDQLAAVVIRRMFTRG